MKKALLVCLDKYPNGDAGAVRTHTFAKMLASIGYEPTVVGMGPSTDFRVRREDGVSYISMRAPSDGIVAKVGSYAGFCNRLTEFAFATGTDWDVILVSDIPKRALRRLNAYAHSHGISLLHDSVEWYSPEQFSLGRLHPVYMAKDRLNRRLIDRSMRVIAISSYLRRHFSEKGIATLRIPAIMDVAHMPCDKRVTDECTVFAYAGSPGKKDYLKTVIEGFAKVTTVDTPKYELRLIGVTAEQLVGDCGASATDIAMLGDRLCCMGRVSRAQVLAQLAQADFTVLMRSQEQRYAKAGFPTKFVESLATATPVITNATSDLTEYLSDGENGFLVPACSAQALAQTLGRALSLSFEERRAMQAAARRTALERFDYRGYTEALARFIDATDE